MTFIVRVERDTLTQLFSCFGQFTVLVVNLLKTSLSALSFSIFVQQKAIKQSKVILLITFLPTVFHLF